MWIGSLSLAGIPFFAGFYSKDSILNAAWASGTAVGRYSYCLGIFTAFLTAFYSWRLLIMTFHGKPRADEETMHHVHESPWVMLIPLFVLAAGAVFAGYLAEEWFRRRTSAASSGSTRSWCCRRTIRSAKAEELTGVIEFLPLIAGVARHRHRVSVLFDRAGHPGPAWRCSTARCTCSCSTNGISTSSTTGCSSAPPSPSARGCGRPATAGSSTVSGPDGIAAATRELAREASRLQTGYVYHYAFAMLIGVVALVTWYLLPR